MIPPYLDLDSFNHFKDWEGRSVNIVLFLAAVKQILGHDTELVTSRFSFAYNGIFSGYPKSVHLRRKYRKMMVGHGLDLTGLRSGCCRSTVGIYCWRPIEKGHATAKSWSACHCFHRQVSRILDCDSWSLFLHRGFDTIDHKSASVIKGVDRFLLWTGQDFAQVDPWWIRKLSITIDGIVHIKEPLSSDLGRGN